jgi:hypothetical protein
VNYVADIDPCSRKFCGKGRDCHVTSEGEARCVCAARCPHHARLVCGTDGRAYHSHCELHRAACLQRRAIAVDHAMTCLKRHRKPPPSSSLTGEIYHINFIFKELPSLSLGDRNNNWIQILAHF